MQEHPRYSIVETIAKGDFATVSRGLDLELDREIAIKQIHAQYLDDPQELDRYWQEAQLMANLEHARIMTIYDIVRDRGWLILELMLGSIQQLQDGRPIDLNDQKSLLISMARALRFLEQNGIMHGDVKPSNMLVAKSRQLKLGDFGIARRLSGDDGSVVKGTTKYMAPEVVSDQFGKVGPHSDLYSLGFSAFELMAGQHFESLFPGLNMFGRDRQIAWMMWHSAPDRSLPDISQVFEGVPEDVAYVVQKLCEKDPAKRYRTADEVLDDLQKESPRESKQQAEEQAKAEELAKQAKKKRYLAIGAVAVSFCLSIGMLFMPGSTEPPPEGQVEATEPDQGILVGVDMESLKLNYRRASDGEGRRLTFDPKSDQVFLNGSRIGFEELLEGDQIAIEVLRRPDDSTFCQIEVARATVETLAGRIADVDSLLQKITLTQGDSPDQQLVVSVRSALIQLNDEPAPMGDIQNGDTAVVDYVAKGDGFEAKSVVVTHVNVLERVVQSVDPPSGISVRASEEPTSRSESLSVAKDCPVTLNGTPAGLAALADGDRVTLRFDSQVRRIDAQRRISLAGIIQSINHQTRQLVIRSADGNQTPIVLSEACRISLENGGDLVDLKALRNGDEVAVSDLRSGPVASIQVVLKPARRSWAIVVGCRQDGGSEAGNPTTAASDAERIRRTLVTSYRVATDQLLDANSVPRRGLGRAVEGFLSRIASSDQVGVEDRQLIVYYAGPAYLVGDEAAYIAPDAFDLSGQAALDLSLEQLLMRLDQCPVGSKILLLDVQHRATGHSATEIVESIETRTGTIAQSVYVIANCDRGQVNQAVANGTCGLFAACADEAFQGAADYDKNQQVTPVELFNFLEPTLALRSQRKQTPVLYEPRTPSRLSPDALVALRDLLELLGDRNSSDDSFSLSYATAVPLAPRQPDVFLIKALRLLKQGVRTNQARDEFKRIVEDHPDCIVANHALALLSFRSREYSEGVEYLEHAIASLPDDIPSTPPAIGAYALNLCTFAGESSAFAYQNLPELQPRLSAVYQIVQRHGGPMMAAYGTGFELAKKKLAESSEFDKKNVSKFTRFDIERVEDFLKAQLDTYWKTP